MFGIPVIGALLQMFVQPVLGYFTKVEDTQQVKIKVDGDVKTAKISSETAELQARSSLAIATLVDAGTRLGRDLMMFPICMWVALKMWYLCIHNLSPDLTWEILDIPESIQYIPYAIVAYLFVTVLKR